MGRCAANHRGRVPLTGRRELARGFGVRVRIYPIERTARRSLSYDAA